MAKFIFMKLPFESSFREQLFQTVEIKLLKLTQPVAMLALGHNTHHQPARVARCHGLVLCWASSRGFSATV